MAASSPRCIQQGLPILDPSIPLKLTTSPLSSPSAPHSYLSDLDPSSSSDHLLDCNSHRQRHHHHHHHPQPPPTNNSSNNKSILTHPVYTTSDPNHRRCIAALLSTKFYGPCPAHPTLRKNDLNLFCTNHAVKICQYCHHAQHSRHNSSCTVLHVSRYMYHDVLLAKEAAALLDIADVQSYLNNGNRVVYIDRRAQPKSKLAPHAKACLVCSRTLQDPYRFCSVFCRLAHANDPAAVATVPVPDACPLLQQTTRKPKEKHSNHISTTSKRSERHVKRFDRSSVCRSLPHSPVTPPRSSLRSSTVTTPPLHMLSIRKKSRRKGLPRRSPLPHGGSMFLFHTVNMLA